MDVSSLQHVFLTCRLIAFPKIACSRSRFHIDPDFLDNESVVSEDSGISIEEWQKQFKPVAQKLQKVSLFFESRTDQILKDGGVFFLH